MASRAIRNVAFDVASETVTVTYEWEPLILDRARAVALSPEEIKQLREARQALAALLAHRAPGSVVSLEILSATLSAGATIRSATAAPHCSFSPAILPISTWQRWFQRPVPGHTCAGLTTSLAGRHDLAQHFAVSATLAAWAGEPVADAIGLYKEMSDARHGSGFSFIDLAADRAGTRFGELYDRKPSVLLERLGSGLHDGDLLPRVGDLPEFLAAEQFRQRFESPSSPAFQAVARDIENRLDTLPLYR